MLSTALGFFLGIISTVDAQPRGGIGKYQIYSGNTHAHTSFTWSHGAQFEPSRCREINVYAHVPGDLGAYQWTQGYEWSAGGCATIYVINSWQYPSRRMVLRPDWRRYQGTPWQHYRAAKRAGFDFYATSDHSQEAAFRPTVKGSGAWQLTKRDAAAATDRSFVALAGFEYSQNDGVDGTGHLNVINSRKMLNALMPGNNLPRFYHWLETAKANGKGPVVASFNHPGPHQYSDWSYRDPAITDVITMLEVVNSNSHIHYAAFVNALDKGWKVSPVAGLDNHGLPGIAKSTSRTFVLARTKSKVAILDAMKHRRTYAAKDENIACWYTVNGKMMGSTLRHPEVYRFHIVLYDPDLDRAADKITKIDIVTNGGEVLLSHLIPKPTYSVEWSPLITNRTSRYFFVRVWNAGGGDGPRANPEQPVAWLAPVWTGR